MKHEESVKSIDKLDDIVRFLIPNYIKEGKYNLVIGIRCTGESIDLLRCLINWQRD